MAPPVEFTSKLQRRAHPFSSLTHFSIRYSFFDFSIWLFIHSFFLTHLFTIYSPFIVYPPSLIYRGALVIPYPLSLFLGSVLESYIGVQ
jgi:hypothetical protein